jgi:hypothetical protein
MHIEFLTSHSVLTYGVISNVEVHLFFYVPSCASYLPVVPWSTPTLLSSAL